MTEGVITIFAGLVGIFEGLLALLVFVGGIVYVYRGRAGRWSASNIAYVVAAGLVALVLVPTGLIPGVMLLLFGVGG